MPYDVFRKNTIEMLVLFLLQEKDLYAYEIMKLIQTKSHDLIRVHGGSLYPILYDLKKKGYLTDRKEGERTCPRKTRVYYHLEPSGKLYLEQLMEETAAVHRGLENIFYNK